MSEVRGCHQRADTCRPATDAVDRARAECGHGPLFENLGRPASGIHRPSGGNALDMLSDAGAYAICASGHWPIATVQGAIRGGFNGLVVLLLGVGVLGEVGRRAILGSEPQERMDDRHCRGLHSS